MEQGYSHGVMVESMMEITMMTRNRGEEFSLGLMDVVMMGSGIMENNMEKVFTIHQRERLEGESGEKEREYSGSQKKLKKAETVDESI
jgi:hypothetical protein